MKNMVSSMTHSFTSKKIVEELLDTAGVTINGKEPWDIQVHHPDWYGRILKNPALELGESYMDKWWDCEQLDAFSRKI